MRITGAFLAEAAVAVDDKLHVWGGVLATYTLGAGRRLNVTLVVLTAPDHGTADPAVRVAIGVPSDAGDAETADLVFRVPDSVIDAEAGFAYFRLDEVLPFDGRYTFGISSGDSAISLPLTVRGPQRLPPRRARHLQ